MALFEASRLAGNPFAVRRDELASCALAPTGGQDQFDTRPSLGHQANTAGTWRSTHGHAHSINVENLHEHRITTAPDGTSESSISQMGCFSIFPHQYRPLVSQLTLA